MSKASKANLKNATPVVEAPPAALSPPPTDPLLLALMRSFLQQRADRQADLSEFCHAKHKDWLRYFGFSMERELQWYADDPRHFMLSTKAQQRRREERTEQQQRRTHHGGGPRAVGGEEDHLAHLLPPLPGSREGPVSSARAGGESPVFGSTPTPPPLQRPTSKPAPPSSRPANAESVVSPKVAKALSDGFADPHDPIQSSTPVPGSVPAAYLQHMAARIAEADKKAVEAGPMSGSTMAEVVAALTAPYQRITWRTDPAESALLKTRILYRWLCKHFSATLPAVKERDRSGGAGGGGAGAGKTLTFGDTAAASPSSATSPSILKSALSKKDRAGGGGGDKDPAAASPTAHHVTIVTAGSTGTASEQLMRSRSGDARALSQLFTELLLAAGVGATLVKGSLKGTVDNRGKPTGYLRWAWVIVDVPAAKSTPQQQPLRMLVDVALSMIHVNPRSGIAPFPEPGTGIGLGGTGGAVTGGGGTIGGGPSPSTGAKTAPRPTSPQRAGGPAGRGAAAPLPPTDEQRAQWEAQALTVYNILQQEKLVNYSAARPRFKVRHDLSPHFEPFYFGCDPREFAPLHYPDDADHLLLEQTVTRPQWETFPRLSHLFFQHKLLLDSQKRRTIFQTKAAPLYLSFRLGDTAHTELTAVLLKGPISQQVANDVNVSPNHLGPGYVYSQRTEVDGRVTFTIMAPDVGTFTILVGARRVHDALADPMPSNAPFDPVAMYQVTINFVALNEPILPTQHLTPATIKLVQPPEHKILMGKQRFVVVPTTSRVLAVAIVNKRFVPRVLNVGAVGPNAVVPVVAVGPPPPNTASPPSTSKSTARGKGTAPPSRSGKETTITHEVAPLLPPPPPPTMTPTPAVLPEDVQITMLTLNPATATFEGEVDAQQGSCEVWALIGDPSCLNSGPTRIRAPAAADAAVAAPPPAPEPPAAAAQPATSRRESNAHPSANKKGSVALSEDALPPPPLPPALAQHPIAAALPTEVLQLVPEEPPLEIANGSGGRIRGRFVAAISNLQVVKRIMPKELGLNDGRGVIQPAMLDGTRLYDDLPLVFRLISGATENGRTRTEDAERILGAPLRAVGNYFPM